MSTAAAKKKRILFIINQFFRGGAETALVNLLRTMDSARFDVDLLIFDMIDLPGSLSLILIHFPSSSLSQHSVMRMMHYRKRV